MRTLALLFLVAGCSLQTEAVDDYTGTSCGYYAADTLTVDASSDCWSSAGTGVCFMSDSGACHGSSERFSAGQALTLWCPIGHAAERRRVYPVACEASK